MLTWRQGQALEPDAHDSAAGRDGGNGRVQDAGGRDVARGIHLAPIHASPGWGPADLNRPPRPVLFRQCRARDSRFSSQNLSP